MTDSRIGVDESGKGDYFGPLVIAACYVGPEHLAQLEGVVDSKKLTDKRALALARVIKETCPHSVVTINPPKYNELYEKIKNLNRLLAWGHARAIEDVLEQVPDCEQVISDQFADPSGLQRALMKRGRGVELISRVRAEADVAVAAASVLARAQFLYRLQALGDACGLPLPKGAGPPVLVAGKRIAERSGIDGLREVAKLHFKTTQQLIK